VIAARHRVQAARRGCRKCGDQFLPTLSLQSTLSTTTVDTGATRERCGASMASSSIPIWDGGVRYGALRGAEAMEDAADRGSKRFDEGRRSRSLVRSERCRGRGGARGGRKRCAISLSRTTI